VNGWVKPEWWDFEAHAHVALDLQLALDERLSEGGRKGGREGGMNGFRWWKQENATRTRGPDTSRKEDTEGHVQTREGGREGGREGQNT